MRRSAVILVLLIAAIAVAVATVLHEGFGNGDSVVVIENIYPAPRTPDVVGGADAIEIVAPRRACWQLGLGHSDADSGSRVERGCGPAKVVVNAAGGVLAQLGRQPRSGWWDIGMRLEVDGRIVRDILPARHVGVTIRYDEQLPSRTVLVRVTAPDDGCWAATIEVRRLRGCGSITIALPVHGSVNGVFERTPRAAWTWEAALEVDGKVVQTYGPDSNREYPLSFFYGAAQG